MSFGFSLTDFKEAIVLSKRLYDGIKDAPDEINGIAKDVATLHGVLTQIEEDLRSEESALKAHGEARMKLLQSMGTNAKRTLDELQSFVDKFRTAAEPGQIWRKVQWMASQRKVKKVHQDLSFHVSSFNLLMATMGNSSLLRIEKGLEAMRVDSARPGVDGDAHTNTSETLEIGESSETLPSVQPAEFTGVDSTPGNGVHGMATSISSPATPDIIISQSMSSLPWLSPTPVLAPSVGFREMLESLEDYQQLRMIKVVSSNFQAACFEFYSGKAVWMGSSEAKVFKLPNGRFPTAPHDFTLREWVTKMHTACYGRINRQGGVRDRDFFEYAPLTTPLTLSQIPIIGSIEDRCGKINTYEFEKALLCAIRMCRHLQAWDPLAQLKTLWRILHSESAIQEMKLFDVSVLAAELRPPHARYEASGLNDGAGDKRKRKKRAKERSGNGGSGSQS